MIIHENIQQGTQKWLDLRKGIPTSSLFDQIMTAGTDKTPPRKSDSQEGYMHHLLAERILGRPIDGFKSQWMAHGNEFEDRALAAYEFEHDVTTKKIGFVTTDDGLIGCSPDSFIVEQPNVMVEAKAPAPATHVSYLIAATGASKKYRVQLQGQLWICEKEIVDIITYCPSMPDAVFRVMRDDDFIKELAAHVRAFSGRLEEMAAEFEKRGWITKKPESRPADDITGDFITQDDAEAILRLRFPEMYGEQQTMNW